MKTKKLLLINPVNPCRSGWTFSEGSRFPPIGLGIVAALTPQSWEVVLIDENWEAFAYQEADLVGISAFTAQAKRAYDIAAIYRSKGIPVVMGGIHASMCMQEALEYVDTVVTGEAEKVWPKVVADFEVGKLQRVYHGEWADLAGAPAPRRDLFHPGYMFASVQTSRGCPMDCEFCSVAAFNGQRYRRRSPDEVLAELETIPQKMLFFIDDNIIGYGKEARTQTLAIFKGMVERKLNKWWFCQASLNFGDDEEVLYWAGKAGCKMVFIGLEAEDAEALTQVNKRLNLARGVDAYAEAFNRIHRAGISVLGAFIFGMDDDTPEKLERRAAYMIGSGIDVMQMTSLTPLPGTRLFNTLQEQGRLLRTGFPADWDRYDMAEIIHQPEHMDLAVFTETLEKLHKSVYAWPVILRKAIQTLWRTRQFSSTMFAFNSNLKYRHLSLG